MVLSEYSYYSIFRGGFSLKGARPRIFALSKKGLFSMVSSVAIISSSLAVVNLVQAADNKNLVISEDLEWMKPQASLTGDNIKIDFSNRFISLNPETIQLDAISSQNVVAISNDKLSLNLTIKGFGATSIKVTATDKNGEVVTDQFNVTIIKKGDINGDGVITPADANVIYQVTNGKLKLSEEELKALDINGDGQVTNADAAELMKNYVGKKTDTTINNNFYAKLADVNDAPIAKPDEYVISEDMALLTNQSNSLLKNDIDVEQNTLTVQKVSGPSNGTLTINPDGTFSYVPDSNFYGKDEFVYKTNDGNADSTEEKVTITVLPVNDEPVAVPPTFAVTEDIESNGNLSGYDADWDKLTYTLVENGKKGTVTITDNKTGAFTFKPNANANGSDFFTFKVNDGTVDSQIVTVDVNIIAVNDAPVATQDQFHIEEDNTLTVSTSILQNDVDVENDTLTAVQVTGPTNGTLTLNPDGTFTYVPNTNFFGQDQFVYKANDGQVDSDEKTVTIDVLPVNDTPIANASTLSVTEDIVATSMLTGTDIDGDSLTYTLIENGKKGTVSLTNSQTGAFAYVPNANANGSDFFTFKVNDGKVDSQIVTVDVNINAVNDAPVAAQDLFHIEEDNTLTVSTSILQNDVDVENDPLTAVLVSGPTNGTLTLNSDGTFTYNPNPNFFGQDQFVYKANDGQVDSEEKTVTIDVSPVNDAPIAMASTLTVTEDLVANGTLFGTDIEGDALTYTIVENGKLGTVTLSGGTNYTYQPNPNAYGTDSFTFKVNDGKVDSEVITVEITINPVNDAPIISDVSINGKPIAGETLEGTYIFSDIEQDLEGSSLYQWYRGTQTDGSDKVAIDGATSKQYIAQEADINHYLFFEVQAVAASGEQNTHAYLSHASGKIKPQDLIAPTTVTLLPVNGADDVSGTTDFTITFSEKIIPTNGMIQIYKNDDDSLVVSYSANDTNHITTMDDKVTIKNPGLESDMGYYVVIESGAFTDEAGNPFEGIASKSWSFTTEGQSSLTATTPFSVLSESELKSSGAYIEIQLTGDQFKDSYTAADFILNNAPKGLTIIDAFPLTETSAGLFLEFDGTDFDVNYSQFSVTAKDSATVKGRSVTSNTMEITPEIEELSSFISEYLVGSGDGRSAIEIFFPGTGNPDDMATGYVLEIHQWLENTSQKRVVTLPLFPFYPNMTYNIIDSRFYDAFDIMNLSYYNAEAELTWPGTVINALVLKKDGKIVDTLGDPISNAAKPILPSRGTLVRKSGLIHGDTIYVESQWDLYPVDTYQFFGRHIN
jgi:VCBS repeat-containing protein